VPAWSSNKQLAVPQSTKSTQINGPVFKNIVLEFKHAHMKFEINYFAKKSGYMVKMIISNSNLIHPKNLYFVKCKCCGVYSGLFSYIIKNE
jgi:hypothetical protein